MEVTVVMPNQFYGAVNGNPVGMNIPQTHKDANHDAFVVEIFGFFYFLYHYNLAISGRYNNSLCIPLEATDGTLEEVDENQVNTNANSRDQVKGKLIGNKEMKDSAYYQKKNSADHQGSGSFVV